MNNRILITGANGQLGKSLKRVLSKFNSYDIKYTDVDTLDITKDENLSEYFNDFDPGFCINAAAYTAVDKAEEEKDFCNLINAIAPGKLAKECERTNTVLIHISSDYVYDNAHQQFNLEDSPTNPQSIYAKSKLEGENEIKKNCQKYLIIRTSWLYSEYGNNFVQTMLNLSRRNIKSLKVVNDQIGSPTYAGDLALFISHIINQNSSNLLDRPGIYNFSNMGICSWYEFAKEIFHLSGIEMQVNAIPGSEYPTPALRPMNSRMSKKKLIENFNIFIPHWKESLAHCLMNID